MIDALLLGELKAGRPAAVAVVVRKEGSAPRAEGARIVLAGDGRTSGSVGGGLLEARTLEACRTLFERGGAALLEFDMTSIDPAADMICGGRVTVLAERVEPASLSLYVAAARGEGTGFVADVTELPGTAIYAPGRGSGRPTISVMPDPAGGQPEPLSMAPPLSGRTMRHAIDRRLVRAGEPLPDPARILLDSRRAGLAGDGGRLMFVEPLAPPDTALFLGGGHVCLAAAALAANVGFLVEVVDDREEFASPERFPMARNARALPGFAGACEGVSTSHYVVIATRGHSHDLEALAQALATPARYVGMIGSRAKRDAIYGELLSRGFTPGDISRVHSPIGLDIGAKTPEEIAVSIVAELIRERHRP
jgi:xanthine dehydrogenase accessory factor